jgi:hypothetical protein
VVDLKDFDGRFTRLRSSTAALRPGLANSSHRARPALSQERMGAVCKRSNYR